ncbi:PfkB family carbohydrate kinase [Aeromicrobium sp. UC242_57]|uniref:PfkB family carbohydrate kinase n=1 Tax=Aeromicrobium sp. UC242_57 TaxID=3374624 RepID=UPI0037B7BF4B
MRRSSRPPARRAWAGKGANQAAAAGALAPQVSMVGRVGDDEAATVMLDDLTSRGVDVSGVVRTPGVPSGAATVVVEDVTGENLIIVDPGANGVLQPADVGCRPSPPRRWSCCSSRSRWRPSCGPPSTRPVWSS